MKQWAAIGQAIAAIILTVCILLQNQGGGLGSAWGGSGEFYRSKRGVEKIIFQLAIGSATAFLFLSIINVM